MMYYYDGLTLTEIGQVLGVTESRVCQIHTKALRQLRSKLADRPETVTASDSAARADGSGRVRCRSVTPAASRELTRRPGRGVLRRALPGNRAKTVHPEFTHAVARGPIRRYGTRPNRERADRGPRHAFAQEGVRPGGIDRLRSTPTRARRRPLPVDALSRRRRCGRPRCSRRSPTSSCSTATPARTWPPSARPGRSPRSISLMDLCIDKNLIDKDEYPQTAEIERRCVHMLADLWNAPRGRGARRLLGHRVVGGLHARRHGGQVALAGQAPGRREADRHAQHGVRPGPGGLAQVRQVLGHRDAGDPHVPGALPAWTSSRCSNGSTRTPSWWCPPSG